MGTFLDDLDDHEGYADRRLPNGQLAGGVWTYATREFTAYVAVCGCGWQASGEHPPTEDGEEAAVDQWRSEHATPELARQTTRRRGTLGLELRWLGTQADRLEDPGHPDGRQPRRRPCPPARSRPPARAGAVGPTAGGRR